MHRTKASLAAMVFASAFASASPSVRAQTFPDKPVTIVVPFAAGGGADVIVRSIGAALSARWKQPVVIDNRTGAGSLIGAEVVAHAKPDGYTLLGTTSQTFTSNRYLYKSLPYDPDKSFVPISMAVKADQFVVANPKVAAGDLKQLVAQAKVPGNSLVYGSWGSGSEPQIVFEQLNKHEHLQIVHVPYKGVAPVLQALTSGEVSLSVASAAVAAPLMEAHKLKPLALAGSARSKRFPNVPTTAEQGFPYIQTAILIGLFAPAQTPPDVLRKIRQDVKELLADPEFSAQIAKRGFDVLAAGPEDTQRMLAEETARIGEVVQAAGIKPE